MIGNEQHAAQALAGTLEFLAEGSTRDCYIADGIVYKVDCTDEQTNIDEYRNATSLVAPDPFVIPPVHLFANGVLSMPYIQGVLSGECSSNLFDLPCEDEGACMPETVRDIAYTIGQDIATWGNTIYVGDGLYYLIDLGHLS